MARTYGWCSLRKNHIDMPSETSPGANGAAKRNYILQCNGLAAISLSSLLSVPNEHNTADQEAWPDAQGSPGYNPDADRAVHLPGHRPGSGDCGRNRHCACQRQGTCGNRPADEEGRGGNKRHQIRCAQGNVQPHVRSNSRLAVNWRHWSCLGALEAMQSICSLMRSADSSENPGARAW